MRLTFFGAARTVTGSAFFLECAGGNVLVDCGLFQGPKSLEKRNRRVKSYHPSEVDALVLTHAHIDHSGLLPAFVRSGFEGPVYCTPATRDLCEIMLEDSAHIQQMEAEWHNRKKARDGGRPVDPLYTQLDVRAAMQRFEPVTYRERVSILPEVQIRFQDAGHILGSSAVEMWVTEDHRTTKIVFSGDLGRKNRPILPDPQPIEDAEVLLVESTYGDRPHKSEEDTLEEFLSIILKAFSNGGKLLIPAFAVGRTQEVLYLLHELHHRGRLPPIPVYVDSPLAIAATEVFKSHPECFDGLARAYMRSGDEPLSLPRLTLSRTSEQSRAINELTGPAIVIAASGMCNAGRIKHHLKHNLWRPEAHVVFIGYQAKDTIGRKIVEGARRIRLFGESIAVRAHIHTLGGFSAHADRQELLEWVDGFRNKALRIFVVHGEEKSALSLAEAILERGYPNVSVPALMDSQDLAAPRAAGAGHPPGSRSLLGEIADLERTIRALRKRLALGGGPAGEPRDDLEQRVDELRSILAQLRSLMDGVE